MTTEALVNTIKVKALEERVRVLESRIEESVEILHEVIAPCEDCLKATHTSGIIFCTMHALRLSVLHIE